MQKTNKDMLVDILGNWIDDILTSTGCIKHWGEVTLPECMREELETEQE